MSFTFMLVISLIVSKKKNGFVEFIGFIGLMAGQSKKNEKEYIE